MSDLAGRIHDPDLAGRIHDLVGRRAGGVQEGRSVKERRIPLVLRRSRSALGRSRQRCSQCSRLL